MPIPEPGETVNVTLTLTHTECVKLIALTDRIYRLTQGGIIAAMNRFANYSSAEIVDFISSAGLLAKLCQEEVVEEIIKV